LQSPSTASSSNESAQFFKVTHPFHPLYGQSFEYLYLRHNWGDWRVYFYGKDSQVCSLPACWTDVAPVDLFLEASAGRAYFRTVDLLDFAKRMQSLLPTKTPKKSRRTKGK